MKISPSLVVARIAVVGLAFALSISAHGAVQANAETPTTEANTAKTGKAVVGKKKAVAAVAATGGKASSASSNAVSLLDQAYGMLRIADHDYKGHRVHAMHQIEAAAKELGTKLSGGGKGDEKQTTSDSQLHSAQSLLQQAVGEITGKAHHHVAEALKHLSIALSVK